MWNSEEQTMELLHWMVHIAVAVISAALLLILTLSGTFVVQF